MEIRNYITPLLKWWWLIVLSTVIAGASSYLAVRNQPPQYESRTTLMIGSAIDDPNPTGSQFTLSQQLAQTYADIARREPVYNATKEALGLNRLPPYSVNALPNTQLIEISVVDTSPERSYAVAKELADQLIRLSPSGQQQEEIERQEFISQELSDLQTKIEDTKAEIEAQQEVLGELFSAQEIADTQSQITALEAKLNTLQANYAALLANTQQGAINALSIIANASVPNSPINSSKMTTVLTAAAVGFALSAAAAYFLEYLDDTVNSPEQVERIADLPMLTGIGKIKESESKSKLITLEDPHSPVSEAFRVLRLGIQYSHVDKPRRILLVTSPNPGDGKSVIAANLAVVLAQAGSNVLLIDCDLRRPVQHDMFGLNNKYGLSSLLLQLDLTPTGNEQNNDVLVEGSIQGTAEPGLSILTSGYIPPYPTELLSSQKLKRVLVDLTKKYDYLILDSSPVLPVTDAYILGAHVDGVILIVNNKKTRQKELKKAIRGMREIDANLIGVVMNRITLTKSAYKLYYKEHDVNVKESWSGLDGKPVTEGLDRSYSFLSRRQRKEQT